MNVRRGGLGRGLGALIPAAAADGLAGVGARFEEVPIDLIDPNPRQPREVFDETAMAELVISIREVGVLQPVVVREVDGGRYQLIMGERRLRASRLAGLDRVPAIVRETPDEELLRDALLENLHRQQLNPLEEAAAYQQLLTEFGATHEELAERIGRSRSHVSNTLRLMNLPGTVQRRVAAGVISAGHARALLALEDAESQEQLANRIVAEGLSVRAVEEIVTAPEPEARQRRTRTRVDQPPTVADVERELAAHLDTRVRVDLGRRRGKITIEFADEPDLRRLAALIHAGGPGTVADTAPSELPQSAVDSWRDTMGAEPPPPEPSAVAVDDPAALVGEPATDTHRDEDSGEHHGPTPSDEPEESHHGESGSGGGEEPHGESPDGPSAEPADHGDQESQPQWQPAGEEWHG